MQSFQGDASLLLDSELTESAGARIVSVSNDALENRTVSECGRYERFNYNGYHFELDWDEIDPPGTDYDEPGIPHEQVMEETRELIRQLQAKR